MICEKNERVLRAGGYLFNGLSADELDGVAGGKGFIPSAIAAIIMFTSAAPVFSSAGADERRSGSAGRVCAAEEVDRR